MADFNAPATGLGTPVTFGKPQLYPTIRYPLTDETQLAIPTNASIPPPVAVFPVPHARLITRTESPSDPLVVAGDGQGLVEAAAAGLLTSNPTIFYSATFAGNQSGPEPSAEERRRAGGDRLQPEAARRVGHGLDNYGYVEQATDAPGLQPGRGGDAHLQWCWQ